MLGFRNAVCFLDLDSFYTSLLSYPDFNCCVDASVSVAGMILECSRAPLMSKIQTVCPVWWVIRGNGAGFGAKNIRTPSSSYGTAGYLDYRDPG